MSNDESTQAERRTGFLRRISPVWIIPLGVVLIGGWLVYQNTLSKGPEVTLLLENAEGLEAGKTAVKVRNVTVGRVEQVQLSDDYSRAVAVVQMNPGTARLLVEDSQFWVVKPRVSRRGVSGLGTIISGAYIRLRPGESETAKRRFEVPDHPPVTHEMPGLSLRLTSRGDASLDVGDPVLYRGRPVGQIDRAEFDTGDQHMQYKVFIRSPYDRLVTRNTQFWKRSGIDVEVGSEGVQLQTGSLQSLVLGGVAFGVPEGIRPGSPVQSGDSFRLFESRDAALQERFDRRVRYVVLFRDSVRGLHSGAAVEFHGIRVGTVSEVPFLSRERELALSRDARIPVLISFEPQRLDPSEKQLSLSAWKKRLKTLFRRGLHASIRPANLVTGAMYVDLQYGDTPVTYRSRTVSGYPVFPSRPGGFTNIEQKAARLLDTINELDLDETLKRTRSLMKNINAILESDAAKDLPDELRSSLREVRRGLRTYQEGGAVHGSLKQSLERLNRVLKDLEPLAESLRNDPSALIYGRDPAPDPVPRAAD